VPCGPISVGAALYGARKLHGYASGKSRRTSSYRQALRWTKLVRPTPNLNLDTLAQLGDLVYPGGGKEIVEKVRQVRAGERLQL
jgi:hypothetical protein